MTDRSKYLDRIGGRIYFRINGKRQRLPDDETSPEFAAAYDALIAGRMAPKPPSREAASAGHAGLDRLVHRTISRIGVFSRPRWPRAEVLSGHATELSAGVGSNPQQAGPCAAHRSHARQRRRLSRQGCSASTRRPWRCGTRSLLSNLWKFARGFAEFKRNGKTNPTADVGSIYTVEQEHEPWPDDVQDRFIAACDANLYLAYHLLLCTGQRVSDVAA